MPWGRREGEPGNLPLQSWIWEGALNTQAFDMMSPRNVPVLINEFETEENKGQLFGQPVQPGQRVHGVVLSFMSETRAYLVGHLTSKRDSKGKANGLYPVPVVRWV